MTENTTPATETPAAQPAAPATPEAAPKAKKKLRKSTPADKAAKAVFATAEEAKAVTPDNKAYRVFRVMQPSGVAVYTWADGPWGAVVHVARAAGYKANVLNKAPTPEAAADILAALSPEQRAAVLARFGGEQPAEETEPAEDQPAAEEEAPKTRRRR